MGRHRLIGLRRSGIWWLAGDAAEVAGAMPSSAAMSGRVRCSSRYWERSHPSSTLTRTRPGDGDGMPSRWRALLRACLLMLAPTLVYDSQSEMADEQRRSLGSPDSAKDYRERGARRPTASWCSSPRARGEMSSPERPHPQPGPGDAKNAPAEEPPPKV